VFKRAFEYQRKNNVVEKYDFSKNIAPPEKKKKTPTTARTTAVIEGQWFSFAHETLLF